MYNSEITRTIRSKKFYQDQQSDQELAHILSYKNNKKAIKLLYANYKSLINYLILERFIVYMNLEKEFNKYCEEHIDVIVESQETKNEQSTIGGYAYIFFSKIYDIINVKKG